MAKRLLVGDRVTWRWGAHEAHGRIVERFARTVTRTLRGTRVKRKGTEAEPAFLVEQEDGGQALKSASELKKKS